MVPRKVLVTGAAGHIGQTVRRFLGGRYILRLADRLATIPADFGQETAVAELTDYPAVLAAMQGMDAVVHLGADPSPNAPWESILPNNIVGTRNVLEAAREAGVQKVVIASSNHASLGAVVELGQAGAEMPVWPRSLYGVSKCFAEALGRMYADTYGLHVICLRIGSCHEGDDPAMQLERVQQMLRNTWPYPEGWQNAGMWISNRDMAQIIQKSLDSEVSYGVFYASSDNEPGIWDLSVTKRVLGYQPQDRVQDFILAGKQGKV